MGSTPSLEVFKPESELQSSGAKEEVDRRKKIKTWQKWKERATTVSEKPQGPQRPPRRRESLGHASSPWLPRNETTCGEKSHKLSQIPSDT